MRKLSLIALTTSVVVSSFAFLASSASAIPVFARKYNVQCNMCHTVPPRLNKFGVAYKENGFELPPGTVLPENEVYGNQVLSTDEPKAIVGAGFPFMIRSGLNLHLSNTAAGIPIPPAPAPNPNGTNPLSASVGEFGIIGGGAMETPLGGLGFWIDAPQAAIGAIDFDFNFNPMFKIAVGTDGPKAGYALALTPLYLGGRNPATQVAGANGFLWGNGGFATIEVRGTTKPETGLGFNYAVGYGLPAGVGGPAAPLAAGDSAPSTVYGHVGYFIDAINSNIGVGIASEDNGLGPVAGVAAKTTSTQTLVDFAYGVGDNFMATIVYNSVATTVGAAAATTTSILTVQPEFAVSPVLTVGGRYSTQTTTAIVAPATTAGPAESTISVGANYKLLQNVMLWINYTSMNNVGNVANATSSGLNSGIDFIY